MTSWQKSFKTFVEQKLFRKNDTISCRRLSDLAMVRLREIRCKIVWSWSGRFDYSRDRAGRITSADPAKSLKALWSSKKVYLRI